MSVCTMKFHYTEHTFDSESIRPQCMRMFVWICIRWRGSSRSPTISSNGTHHTYTHTQANTLMHTQFKRFIVFLASFIWGQKAIHLNSNGMSETIFHESLYFTPLTPNQLNTNVRNLTRAHTHTEHGIHRFLFRFANVLMPKIAFPMPTLYTSAIWLFTLPSNSNSCLIARGIRCTCSIHCSVRWPKVLIDEMHSRSQCQQ